MPDGEPAQEIPVGAAAAPGLHLCLQRLCGGVLPGALAVFLHAQLGLAAQVLPLLAAHLGGGAVRVGGPQAVAVGVKLPLPLVQRFGVGLR